MKQTVYRDQISINHVKLVTNVPKMMHRNLRQWDMTVGGISMLWSTTSRWSTNGINYDCFEYLTLLNIAILILSFSAAINQISTPMQTTFCNSILIILIILSFLWQIALSKTKFHKTNLPLLVTTLRRQKRTTGFDN